MSVDYMLGFCIITSSSALAEIPRELGDFKKARVNGGRPTDNDY